MKNNSNILDGNQRRKCILEQLGLEAEPISGTDLAKKFGVSRQIIVQDIALLRAENRDILSTNKGYVLFKNDIDKNSKAVVMVRHTSAQTLDEFACIVELGGKVLDVSVDHDLYGQIQVDLVINNMEDAEEFVKKMNTSKSKLLKELTSDYHYHTIAAPSEKVLNLIKQELLSQGFLCEEN